MRHTIPVYTISFAFLLYGCNSVCKLDPIDPPYEAMESAIDDIECTDPIFQDAKMPEEWWLIFNDGQLNEFIETALAQNPTLQISANRINASLAIANRVRASLFPYISLGADVSRQKLSETGVIPFASGPAGSNTPVIAVPLIPGGLIPEYFTLYETELNFKYNFDFWNKNRNTYRAALGRVEAEIAELAYSELQLAVQIAKVYFLLQVDYERERNLKALVENREQYLELIRQRVSANVETELTVQTAEFNLIDSNDLLLSIQGEIAVRQYQLMALVAGNFEEDIGDISVDRMPLPQVPMPHNLPLHLISKRADITAQIKLIESAGDLIEVAKAGFYPDFNLNAFFGFQTIHFPELFKWKSTFFNVDPAVSLPIFDGGRLIADLRKSEIDYNEAILQYNQLVIDAAKEVLESIAVVRNSVKRLGEYKSKVAHQEEYFRLVGLRVAHNIGTALDGLTSEGNMLISKDQELVALGRTFTSILDLINALGGGYDSDCGE